MTVKSRLLPIVLVALMPCTFVSASVELKAPQTRPGTYEDTYAQQALGRIEVAADGQFIVYEWARPYFGWVPEQKWMAGNAARRLQTFLYKVDLRRPGSTSEYLFYPNAGCTYWLGDISPDNQHVVVFELSHDDHRVRAGVWSSDKTEKAVHWYTPQVDEGKVAELAAWISNDEFAYPVKDPKAPFARASVISGEARSCETCSATMLRSLRGSATSAVAAATKTASRIEASDVPPGAVLAAGAANGSVAVFIRDTPQTLSLLLKVPDQPAKTVFENARQWRATEINK